MQTVFNKAVKQGEAVNSSMSNCMLGAGKVTIGFLIPVWLAAGSFNAPFSFTLHVAEESFVCLIHQDLVPRDLQAPGICTSAV